MTLPIPVRGLILGLTLLVAGATAFAKDSRSLNIPNAASVGGKQIEAGRYDIGWEEGSPETTVTLSKGKTVVATLRGTIVEGDRKHDRNMVVYVGNPDGSLTISEIRFAGSKTAIVFGQ